MEVENMSSKITSNRELEEEEEEEDDDDVPLPGFRFHPTDEELVGFYLRRKVENKPISIELIKQADIYKYDPWDLPTGTWGSSLLASVNGVFFHTFSESTNVGEKDKEWYFFCKRGRKYKNSVRPNRVTGSGFWKATGIDRPIYSGRDCIGLKKSLVYYRGSAGKGTKTEWMMHEFRLPDKHMDDHIAINAQDPEVWTLCRILKRNVPYRKCVPSDHWRQLAAKKSNLIINPFVDAISSETCSTVESSDHNGQSSYISFSAPIMVKQNTYEKDLYSGHVESTTNQNHDFSGQYFGLLSQAPPAASSFSNYNINSDINELLRHAADWEDLRSVVDCATATNPMYL